MPIRIGQFLSSVFFLLCLVLWDSQASYAQSASDLDTLVQSTLSDAGDNQPELQKALDKIEPELKAGMKFLLAYMPSSDSKTLKANFLLSHVRGAYASWNQSSWKSQISEDMFFNNILPYANVSERREDWQADFRKRFLPMVKSAKTPSEAAVILNQRIFKELNVKYSTKRKRADQGPFESMEGGTASCTGLSILLIDACRSVGVPARFVGTPRWSDNSGNHSWVEIWDGDWKFTGAAEPDGDDLNKGWFMDRAAAAKRDEPMYAIYAVSYRKTDLKFPLVWKRDFDPVWSINVTDRYTKDNAAKEKLKVGDDQVLLRFKVTDPSTATRVAASLAIKDTDGKIVFSGTTNDESFDANDHLNVVLPKNGTFVVDFEFEGKNGHSSLATEDITKLVDLKLSSTSPAFDENEPLTAAKTEIAKKMVWNSHPGNLDEKRKQEMENKEIKLEAFPELKMKYEFKTFGAKPMGGHSLYISMHGGGGAPAKVNERQWKNQIGLYEPNEGIYLAPRAPTDTWNLWHQNHIDPFFDRIIENFVLSGEVNPNRVYLMGYSAGGDGVYQLAPRMADRFAAAAMMAGHPNETKPTGLRNLPFAIYMGGKDAAYKRNEIAQQWKEKLAALKESDENGYQHEVTIYPENGHWMDRKDASALPWMSKHERNVWPKKVVWLQDDVTHDRFYWLSLPEDTAKQRTTITASVEGQRITINSDDVAECRIWLNDNLLDLDKAIQLVVNGKSETHQVTRTLQSLRESLNTRLDKDMMAAAYIDVSSK